MFKVFRMISELQPITNNLLKRVEVISTIPKFTFEDCKKEIESNWKAKNLKFLSGIQVNQPELDFLLKISDCLKPTELQDDKLPFNTRKEICKVLQCDMWEVTKFLILFKTHKRLHEYLIGRIRRKESLPKTDEEIRKMLTQDPLPRSKTSMFQQKRRKTYSVKQKKYGLDKSKPYSK